MSAAVTGGPAFPCEVGHAADDYTFQTANQQWAQPGMMLRDYFAAQVLSNGNSCGSPAQAAKWAYGVADAMLKERAL